ncbi:ribonuclease E inhibitor RraB [Pseudooceanicola sp. 200-1SW]|uniref:ribonuclease E inhibitor RraB n=1 Tax=Pseudooceanicola sp. 200-1SW TaxID=3425949 RepID=UPI003D7F8BEC
MAHDFAAQKAETLTAYGEMQAEHGLPEVADVDYFFVASDEGADWRPLADALTRQEYVCQYVEAEGEEAAYLVATLPDQAISAEGIWIGEELATRAALEHGYAPDGWGLEG